MPLRRAPAVIALAALCVASAGTNPRDVSQINDVATLEQLALGDIPRTNPGMSTKTIHGDAYARLGAIGTPESLAAARRIEDIARTWKPDPPFRLGYEPHPGFHMGDAMVNGELRAELDGRTYAIFSDAVFGNFDLLLISTDHPERQDGWSPPHLIPLTIYRGMHDLQLRAGPHRTLLLSFIQDVPPKRMIMEGTVDRGEAAPQLGPREVSIAVDDVLRDIDHDGLTDVEEERLGLDPRNADSDHDGILDGDDPAPDYKPSSKRSDTDEIFERAFFAVFGLTGSRYTMFASKQADLWPIQVWGYRGHVLYHAKTPYAYGRITVAWKLKDLRDTTASVELSDSEGPLAGGGIDVNLKKIGDRWYVVSIRMGWIS